MLEDTVVITVEGLVGSPDRIWLVMTPGFATVDM